MSITTERRGAILHTKTDLSVDLAGERLDVFVARSLPDITRSRVQRLIAEGAVLVDGVRAKASMRVESGQRVSVDVPEPIEATAVAQDIALDILYEDADLIVVNKPAGMTVHPSPGHESGTLVNAILAHCTDLSGIGGVLRPGIVHRLDRDTSGVILVAKHDAAHNSLARQLKERRVEKTYLALVSGTPKPAEGVIDAPIARDPRNRQRMAVVSDGRESVTAYEVIERFLGASLLQARPKTGRTHQIRVHLAAIGHPIIGDRVYGKPAGGRGEPGTALAHLDLVRHFLHAHRIVFAHPATDARVEFEAPLPPDLAQALATLRGV